MNKNVAERLRKQDEEVEQKLQEELAILRRQLREVRTYQNSVTCNCNKTIHLRIAYKCLDCGIWFCRACGKKHFSCRGS